MRGGVAAGLLLGLLLALPRASSAYDASIGWLPTSGAAGYTLYVRYGTTGTPQPIDVGRPATGADGLVHVVLNSLPLGPTAYFWLAAYDANRTASPVSGTLSITYAQAAVVSDTDGDRLTDAQEDKDLDTTVDAGETNRADADTDNDGYGDGDEVLVYSTNPLSAASVPPASSTTTTTTTTTLGAQCSKASQCNDYNPCTVDACVSKRCTHSPATATCNDGDPCTVGDACSAGECAGWALDCSHLDGPCSYGVCDAQTAECEAVRVASGSRCDDASACTTGEVCSSSGVCGGGTNACAAGTFCDNATKTCKSSTEVWVSAWGDPTATFYGAMTSGPAYADGADADAAADSVEPELVYAASSTNDFNATFADKVSYVVDLPASGQWYLWGRFYYPNASGGTAGNSFYVRIDAGAARRFGNNTGYYRRWHWGGDGRYETGTPVALPLGQLAAGQHTVTIAKREVTPNAPRLDVLVFTRNASWIPTDAKVRLP